MNTADIIIPVFEKFLLLSFPSSIALLYAIILHISPTNGLINANTKPTIERTLKDAVLLY